MVKILTIEDSAFERAAIIEILKDSGYSDIIEAEDAEKGVEIFKAESPDVVLQDLRLPGMDGLECIKKLKEINPAVKVIVLTIVGRKDSIEEAQRLGVVDYVLKPITKEKLVPALEKAL